MTHTNINILDRENRVKELINEMEFNPSDENEQELLEHFREVARLMHWIMSPPIAPAETCDIEEFEKRFIADCMRDLNILKSKPDLHRRSSQLFLQMATPAIYST